MWQLMEQYIPGFETVSKTTWVVFGCICAAIWILNVIALWKVFEKAGEKGWKSLIPVYNVYMMFKIAWTPKAFLNVIVFSFIAAVNEWQLPTAEGAFKVILPICGLIATVYAVVISISMSIRMSKAFGHGVLYGLGLYFFEVPFIMVLGFGKSQYTRPAPDPKYADPHKIRSK